MNFAHQLREKGGKVYLFIFSMINKHEFSSLISLNAIQTKTQKIVYCMHGKSLDHLKYYSTTSVQLILEKP